MSVDPALEAHTLEFLASLSAPKPCDCAQRLRDEADACQPQPGAVMPHPDLVARVHRAVWYRDAARWLASGRKEDA